MLEYYYNKKIEETVEALFGEGYRVIPVGNHELERHLVYRLVNAEGYSLILKLFFKKNRWNREVASLKTLAGSSVKCPELKGYGVLDDGTEWLATGHLDGEMFFKVKESMDLENRTVVYEQMGEELGKIHAYKEFGFFGNWDHNCNSLDQTSDYSEVFIRRAEMTIDNLLKQGLPDHKIHREAARIIRQNYGKVHGVRNPVLCHNDYDERNILVDKVNGRWTIKGVLDFEQSLPWDRDRDIVELYHSLEKEGFGLEQALLRGYNRFNIIDEAFFKKMNYYLLYAGVNICSWSYRAAHDYYRRGIELIKEFMEKN